MYYEINDSDRNTFRKRINNKNKGKINMATRLDLLMLTLLYTSNGNLIKHEMYLILLLF